ncbi:Leo1-like protein domain-containing protein [Rozella allomycis CSF55]|uniref:Leo1-like protein domain-containing protein n=1 Tax=Rozella allomycis (strain CSF55) TaxID=988480 RepID=A0A075B3J6_ROZAC|nr:Leo1-like protein domain-containing protein [Rozella allomycis CSF55]|eukprot:EPZ35428.1 Leo1-like protein domain-containing protein [Rozella allomycis CSF55]
MDEHDIFGSDLSDLDEHEENITIERQPSEEENNLKTSVDEFLGQEQNIRHVNLPEKQNLSLNDVALVSFPKFITVSSHPALANLDDEPNDLVLLKNTIRYRYNEDEIEGNSRIVKWSDGSMSLVIGQEIYDIQVSDVPSNQNIHLMNYHVNEATLEGYKKVEKRMMVSSNTNDKGSHDRITQVLSKHLTRESKIKSFESREDPEILKAQLERVENEKMRSQRRLETKRRIQMEKEFLPSMELNVDALEQDEDDEDEENYEDDLKVLKAKKDIESDHSDLNEETLSDDSENNFRLPKQAKPADENDKDSAPILARKRNVVDDE